MTTDRIAKQLMDGHCTYEGKVTPSWGAIGGVGIQAKAWNLTPNPAWLSEEEDEE